MKWKIFCENEASFIYLRVYGEIVSNLTLDNITALSQNQTIDKFLPVFLIRRFPFSVMIKMGACCQRGAEHFDTGSAESKEGEGLVELCLWFFPTNTLLQMCMSSNTFIGRVVYW